MRGDPYAHTDGLRKFAAAQNIAIGYSEDIAPARGTSYGGRIALLPGQSPAEEFSTLGFSRKGPVLKSNGGASTSTSSLVSWRCLGGRRLEDQALVMLRGQLANIEFGAVFLFIGLAACSVAAIRRQSGVRLVIWLGIWSAMYGTGLQARSPAVVAALPLVLQTSVPYVNTLIAYLLAVVAMSAFLELSRGGIRLLIKILILAQVVIAVVGIGWFAVGGSADKFILYHRLVSDCGLLILITVVTVKKLSDKFLVLFNRRVLVIGTLV